MESFGLEQAFIKKPASNYRGGGRRYQFSICRVQSGHGCCGPGPGYAGTDVGVGLKTRHAATARSGAGHVVAETWLDDLEKWVVADHQLGYVFMADGIPLNAVEFGEPLAKGPGSIEVLLADVPVSWYLKNSYLVFVGQYLYYFDSSYDQRLFLTEQERKMDRMMLAPEGFLELKVSQRENQFKANYFTSSVDAFYVAPETVW